MSEKSHFEKLASINVAEHIEKKNNLSYLSWAWAVDQLLRQDPCATWEYKEPMRWNDTVMVFCTVTAFGKAMTAQLPVMDYRNKAISNPDAFAVNTAMQRCLAKAIALHGLGLYIYAGEDLPLEEEQEKPKGVKHKPTDSPYVPTPEEETFLLDIVDKIVTHGDDYSSAAEYLSSIVLDNDEKVWVWSKLDSKMRSGIKKHNEAKKQSN